MGKKFVYLFNEGNDKMKNTLGGKGANLAGMTKLGLPVPYGFVVSTDACVKYYDNDKVMGDDVVNQIFSAIKKVENKTQKGFGNLENPLLFAVRSGARVSMPGMMNTVLNLGLNDKIADSYAKKIGNGRFVYDSYRRLIMMYSDVVVGINRDYFEEIIHEVKKERKIKLDKDLSEDDLKNIIKQFKVLYKKHAKTEFPQDPYVQVVEAVKAVFRSWDTPRAVVYRKMHDIPSNWGTAVNIQSMVFGNVNDNSGSGVAFTRNPATGVNEMYGEYLMNAQGEDVVAGIRTPNPLKDLKETNKKAYDELLNIFYILEHHFKDMQEVEFTIEDGKLYMLQTRNGKRTAQASLKIAIDLVKEKLLTEKEALLKIEPKILDSLLHPVFIPSKLKLANQISKGLPASPGAASGRIALTPEKAKEYKMVKQNAILVRAETSPEDIEGMISSVGILTATGGMTSHAAVVARGIGTSCVAGCSDLIINEKAKEITLGKKKFKEGDVISIDGTTGAVYDAQIETQEAKMSEEFSTIMKWADKYSTMKVRANADNKRDATVALQLGAVGIGLVRTEHMFFDAKRIPAVREMILAPSVDLREKALNKILPMQRKDFTEIFSTMKSLPVTIRLLDMPLHEFLPKEEKDIKELAKSLNISLAEVEAKIETLSEFNPMMGFRGCRLSIVMPEIAVMQTRAIIEAAIDVKKVLKIEINPEIMIPLVGDINEIHAMKKVVTDTANAVIKTKGVDINYTIGTMIEVPRATIISDKLANETEFFSFGTNDLTQMTYGYSRDDAGKFLTHYYDQKILQSDPFASIDEDGVGYLIDMSIKKAKTVKKKDFKFGICGEHGGDPKSVDFAYRVGMTYVSCSPYRVPIARVASAQAQIRNGKRK